MTRLVSSLLITLASNSFCCVLGKETLRRPQRQLLFIVGGKLTRPISRKRVRINSTESEQSEKTVGAKQEVYNREGVAEDGQSITKWKMTSDMEPQLLHEDVLALPILWRYAARRVLCPLQRKRGRAQRAERRRVSSSSDTVEIRCKKKPDWIPCLQLV